MCDINKKKDIYLMLKFQNNKIWNEWFVNIIAFSKGDIKILKKPTLFW